MATVRAARNMLFCCCLLANCVMFILSKREIGLYEELWVISAGLFFFFAVSLDYQVCRIGATVRNVLYISFILICSALFSYTVQIDEMSQPESFRYIVFFVEVMLIISYIFELGSGNQVSNNIAYFELSDCDSDIWDANVIHLGDNAFT